MDGFNKKESDNLNENSSTYEGYASSLNLSPLLIRAEILIGDGDFDKADGILEKVLDNDPLNSKAYFFKSLIALRAHSAEDLVSRLINPKDESNFKKALKFADEEQRKQLEEILISIDKAGKQKIFDEAASHERKGRFKKAKELFSSLNGYKDSEERAEECERKLKERKEKQSKELQGLLKKAKNPALITLVSLVAAASISMVFTTIFYFVPEHRQAVILDALNARDYDKALATINDNASFRDNHELQQMCFAGKAFDQSDYEAGIEYVLSAGGRVDVTYDSDGGNCRSKDTIKAAKRIDNDPKKNGHTFSGWKLTTYSMNASDFYVSLKLKALYDLIEYSISYDLGGGCMDGEISQYNIEESVALPNPTRKGYVFLGWTGSNGTAPAKDYVQKAGATGDKAYTANWQAEVYEITYVLNGGTNSSSNPSFYTIESPDIELFWPSKKGYRFLGWKENGEMVISIPKGSTGNKKLEASWKADKNVLNVITSDDDRGSVLVSGKGYTDEKITVTATAFDGYTFKGWYSNNDLVTMDNPYSFTMPASDVSLIAMFFDEADEKQYHQSLGIEPVFDLTSKTLTYGLYPQTHVNDEATIARLDLLPDPEDGDWYLYKGKYYAKVKANPYESNYVFDDGEKIGKGTTYWFKCEPISWNILSSSDGTYSLVSSVILDAHRYNEYYQGQNSNGKYPCDYGQSEIRAWFNGDFYQTAFSFNSDLVTQTSIDGLLDKVYLLSYDDYNNTTYFKKSTLRGCKTTDWARANYAMYADVESYQYYGYSWTRSTHSTRPDGVYIVNPNGFMSLCTVNADYFSARPAITIKTQS